jgi:cytoskeleton protein RodZ
VVAVVLALVRSGRDRPPQPIDGVALRVPPTPHAPRPEAPPRNPAAGAIGAEGRSTAQPGAAGVNLLTGRSPAAVGAPSAATQTRDEVPAAADAQIAPELRPAAAASSIGAPVRLVFDEDSWVEVTDRSGDVVFSRLNPAGTTRLIRGEPPLSMVIGNARGVQLYFQDKRIDLGPHTRIDVARVVLE